MRRTYSRDFKIKVCELVIKENLSTAIVAEKFGIHRVMLCRWVSEYQEYGSEAFVGTGHQKMENEILKKAAAYFAKDPENG